MITVVEAESPYTYCTAPLRTGGRCTRLASAYYAVRGDAGDGRVEVAVFALCGCHKNQAERRGGFHVQPVAHPNGRPMRGANA